MPYQAMTADRQLALTFDDGPNPPHTDAILNALAERNVPATFFVVGRCAERHPDTVRRIVAEGHVLGNHSYAHRLTDCLTPARQRTELQRADAALLQISGVSPALYRPPWMCRVPGTLSTIAGFDLQPVSGTFVHRFEVFQPPAHWLVTGALRAARPGRILIGHDGREARGGFRGSTAAAVAPLVDQLLADGYQLTTVDKLLGVPAYR